MDLSNNIGKKIPTITIIKSLAWNSILQIFQEEGKDISSYLNSIEIKGNTVIIKTKSPLINSEIRLREGKIRATFQKKLQKTGVQFNEYSIKYL